VTFTENIYNTRHLQVLFKYNFNMLFSTSQNFSFWRRTVIDCDATKATKYYRFYLFYGSQCSFQW